MRRCLLALFLFCLSAAAPAAADEAPLKRVSLSLLWSPQAQFAGYYVAQAKGIYRQHGLDLTIIPGAPGRSPRELLQGGEADFAVLWLATALQHDPDKRKLIHLAQLVQKSSMVMIAKRSSGILLPADFAGKKVGVWGGDLALPAQLFFKKYQLSVRSIPQSYTVNLFLRDGIDVTSAMWYNEFHTILNSGIDREELNLFFLHEYGIKFPEDGLYTLEKSYRADPGKAEAFVQGSLEGWRYAFAHPEEALDIVIHAMQAAQLPANRAHQRWMLERMRDLILPQEGSAGFGRLKVPDYLAVGEALQSQGLIEKVPGFAEFTGGRDARQ